MIDSLSKTARRLLWVGLSALTLALLVWLDSLDSALKTQAAPLGIVSFELARTAEASAAILASWSPAAREAAYLIQGLDFLFLLAYPAWLSLCCATLARHLSGALGWAAARMAMAIWACVPLDAIENLALLHQLGHGAHDTWATLAWICAIPKFALVAAAILAALVGGIAVLLRPRRH